jgi:hypothetical protein
METSRHPGEILTDDSWEPEISPDGVDLSLIRWMLSLTPTERLATLQDYVDGITTLRNGRKHRD